MFLVVFPFARYFSLHTLDGPETSSCSVSFGRIPKWLLPQRDSQGRFLSREPSNISVSSDMSSNEDTPSGQPPSTDPGVTIISPANAGLTNMLPEPFKIFLEAIIPTVMPSALNTALNATAQPPCRSCLLFHLPLTSLQLVCLYLIFSLKSREVSCWRLHITSWCWNKHREYTK